MSSTPTPSTTKKEKIIPKFVNLSNVSRHLYCCICEDIFKKPIRIKECGHTFCKTCLKKWSKYNKNCPLCRKQFNIKNIKRDNIAYNIINDLEVFCNNNCPWKGKLSELKKHLKKCNFNPNIINSTIKKALKDKNKRISLILNSNTEEILNQNDEKQKTEEKENDIDNDDEEGTTSVDSITSFNTRVGLRARLFNRNKELVNKVMNKGVNKGYSEDSIFSIIEQNNINIKI